MQTLEHRMAGIRFRTELEFALPLLQSGLFGQFMTPIDGVDVYHRYIRISREEMDGPPLTCEEQEFIARCFQLPIQTSTMVVPTISSLEEQDLLENAGQDIKLLHAAAIRERLRECWDHPDQIALSLHALSIVIYDYTTYRIDVFLPETRQWMLSNNLMLNGLRRLFMSFLPLFSAVIVHSSAVIRDGKTALFTAPDSGGKTTVTRTVSDSTILSDDHNIIKREDGQFHVYGAPWGSVTNVADHAPLGGIFLLEQASHFALTPVSYHEVIDFLWNEHQGNWLMLPPPLRTTAFNLVTSICQTTPTYRMSFHKDYLDWDAVDASLR